VCYFKDIQIHGGTDWSSLASIDITQPILILHLTSLLIPLPKSVAV